jgi:hypothetical protein
MTTPGGHDSTDRSDQLSPGRALHESTGATGSQRIGNNGPVGNPTVSFPDSGAEEQDSAAKDKDEAGGPERG